MSVFDAVVIGGGPAGSTVATRLAQAGRNVVILEREKFPRFHIGESLLPAAMPLFEELGVSAELETAGFLRKNAAEFVTADGTLRRRYRFSEGLLGGCGSAYEVDRAKFDEILLGHAARQGAHLRFGARVTQVQFSDDEPVRVAVRTPEGGTETVRGQVVVDCTGQSAFLAGRFGLRVTDPALKNISLFAHYSGARRYSGEREGDITIVLARHGWWWVIPLAGDRTSLGYVAPRRSLGAQRPNVGFFDRQMEASDYLCDRFRGAKRLFDVSVVTDFSYECKRAAGDRWLLAGDAAGFIDPVFSTGVLLGVSGGFRAARAIEEALNCGRFKASSFLSYQRWVSRTSHVYREFVRGFYHPEFAEVLMHPSDFLELRRAVTSLLAGHGAESLDVAWRIKVFRAIARLNRRFELTPRLEERRRASASL